LETYPYQIIPRGFARTVTNRAAHHRGRLTLEICALLDIPQAVRLRERPSHVFASTNRAITNVGRAADLDAESTLPLVVGVRDQPG